MASCSLHASRSPESPKLIQPFWSCPGRPRECPHRGSSKRSRSALRPIAGAGVRRPDSISACARRSYAMSLTAASRATAVPASEEHILFFTIFIPLSRKLQLACDQHHAWHCGSNTDALLCLPLQVFRACRTLHCPEHRSNNVHNENVVSIKS